MAALYRLPLSTGLTEFVRLHSTKSTTRPGQLSHRLLCYARSDDRHPRFVIPLWQAAFVNNITERGSCLSVISATGEYEFECGDDSVLLEWRTALTKLGCRELAFADLYQLTEFIGEGSFAKVYIARHRYTGEEHVVKAVPRERLAEANLLGEVQALRAVQHTAVIKMMAAYPHGRHVLLVLEYLRGGELFDWVQNHGPVDESRARGAMVRLLSALQAMHAAGYVHRDIKTENLILEHENDPSSIKLIDFGLACRLDSPAMAMRCGSPGYVAPEILSKDSYGCKADVFSAGVILHILLAGYPPFRGATARDILIKNMGCEVSLDGPAWCRVSPAAKHMLMALMQRDPARRLAASEALRHPWLTPAPSLLPPPGHAGPAQPQPRLSAVPRPLRCLGVHALRRLTRIVPRRAGRRRLCTGPAVGRADTPCPRTPGVPGPPLPGDLCARPCLPARSAPPTASRGQGRPGDGGAPPGPQRERRTRGPSEREPALCPRPAVAPPCPKGQQGADTQVVHRQGGAFRG